jgi:hypothetical protein
MTPIMTIMIANPITRLMPTFVSLNHFISLERLWDLENYHWGAPTKGVLKREVIRLYSQSVSSADMLLRLASFPLEVPAT